MGFLSNFLDKIKIKPENDDFYYSTEQKPENDNIKKRRSALPVGFCIFVPEENEEIDPMNTPFIYGNMVELNISEAVFSAESNIACSPYAHDAEKEIRPGISVKILLSSAESPSCAGGGCRTAEKQDERLLTITDALKNEIIEAEIILVENGSFRCRFIKPDRKIKEALEKIIIFMDEESGLS